ncbi:superoxide dismutase, Ni [Candidatus Woesearchaeota archaeon]|nr:superoxide dismutase, Ni [Candidatus Woesearchaeota archaeon]
MIKNILRLADKISKPKTVHAHCDIPCGIYDPHLAQVAAHSVVRMVQLMEKNKEDVHAAARYTQVKEEHAELVKHEIRIIWGDYFKPEHLKKYPDLHAHVDSIMKLASKARQNVDMKAAEALLESVNKFAEIFWETKGIETFRAKAPYPTEKEMVLPKLE